MSKKNRKGGENLTNKAVGICYTVFLQKTVKGCEVMIMKKTEPLYAQLHMPAHIQPQQAGFSSYEKKKLLGYADSFSNLAKTFTYRSAPVQEVEQERQERLLKRRLMENREILADNLKEIAQIIRAFAEESYQIYPFREKELRRIIRACRENGMLVKNIYRMEDEVSGMKLAVNMCVADGQVMTAEEAADFLSVLFEKRLLPEKDSLFFLSDDYETLVFEEEAAYSVMTGAAKATRENETVSGDTYSFIEKGNGSMMLALSDGMGSGEKAMADSETVIDLLEKFTEAGFSKETAVEMINGVLVARSEEENMSTLDICDINLYTGECELMKIGSSCTYIKRGREIEQIDAEHLPLGIFHQMAVDKQCRRLQDGDYIIMVSDGIIDGVCGEEGFREFLSQINIQNPQEMANYILQFVLHRTLGKVQDDMTVLTLGIWENGETFPE